MTSVCISLIYIKYLFFLQSRLKKNMKTRQWLHYHLYAASVVTWYAEDYILLHFLEMMEEMFQYQESFHQGYSAVSAVSVEKYKTSEGIQLILK